MKKILFLIVILTLFSLTSVFATASKPLDIVYFYGNTCPHCAAFEEWLDEIKPSYNINPIGFEVYQNETNRELASKIAKEYGTSFDGVPMIFIGDNVFFGFSDFKASEIRAQIEKCISQDCCDSALDKVKACEQKDIQKQKLTFASVVGLAVADSINPCEMAVLILCLIALLAKNPSDRKKVLLGGLMFSLAIFLTYMIYGGIIITFFKFIQGYFVSVGKYIRIIFALFALFLGYMNVKDAIWYKPGSFMTEMPIKLRPLAKKMVSNITSPAGAFIIGVFVTLFLMPCTMGPYFIVGNLLSTLDWVKSLPWLILYNIIFVLPMLIITLVVYLGMKRVEDVSGWKDKHIRKLHLVAGIVLVLMGIAMILGWI
jgi:cytochrome c biogenesis protein CcdA/glutaredoxin